MYKDIQNYVKGGIERIDIDKVLGNAKYVEDILIDNILYAKVFGSECAHGYIERLDFAEAYSLGAIDVVTYKDIPGYNAVGYIPEAPVLAEKKVRFVGEPMVIVVAQTIEKAERALYGIKAIYKPLPSLISIEEAFQRTDVLIHEDQDNNIAYSMKVENGNVNEVFNKADIVISNKYFIQSREHAYLEREAGIAIPHSDGRITVIVPNQYPHKVAENVARVLGISHKDVEVVTPTIGGSFGGKNDMGLIIAAQAALTAFKVKKPVMLIYSREESFIRSTRSEEAVIDYSTAARSDGKLLGVKVKILLDSGAYAIRSPGILWRMAVEATGPYEVPNVYIEGYCVYTNKSYVGAWRGFGTPTIAIAHEAQMDLLANRLGLDPLEIRLKNIVKKGSILSTGEILHDDIGFEEALRRLADISHWFEQKKSLGYNANSHVLEGWGIGCAWHGISIGGGYSKEMKKDVIIKDWSAASITINRDGIIDVYTGIVEMGQGTISVFKNIVANYFGVPLKYVNINHGTTKAPDTGGTHGSRGLAFGGIAIETACKTLKRKLVTVASRILSCDENEITFKNFMVYCSNNKSISWEEFIDRCYKLGVNLSIVTHVDIERGVFDLYAGKGHAWPTYSFAAMVTKIKVNKLTGELEIEEIFPVVAIGNVISEDLVKTQIEGGIIFGIGMSIMESMIFGNDGRVLSDSYSAYLIPTLGDVIRIKFHDPIIVKDKSKYTFLGAKGIGEVIVAPLPASIISAFYNATGKLINKLPLNPERVLLTLHTSQDKNL
uniref:Xanthine dehydrogenase family protein molybdopterin-binding subunit n=1 Tax=Ignisphaera aggregans TaxID=334771 RepID=A0A7J3QDX4_9CREN